MRRGERSARGVRVAGRGARGAGARVVRTVEARGRAEGTAEAGVLAVGRKVGSEAGVRGPQRPALGAVTRRDRSRPPRWVKGERGLHEVGVCRGGGGRGLGGSAGPPGVEEPLRGTGQGGSGAGKGRGSQRRKRVSRRDEGPGVQARLLWRNHRGAQARPPSHREAFPARRAHHPLRGGEARKDARSWSESRLLPPGEAPRRQESGETEQLLWDLLTGGSRTWNKQPGPASRLLTV